AGAAFASALQTYLSGKAGDSSPAVFVVMQSDQPCRFFLSAFATGAAFASDGFAFPLLVASDLLDADGLAARVRGAGDPVSAHLRAEIGRSELLEGLNDMISTGALYDAQRFAGVTLSAETQEELAAADDVPRLNRLLLQDAFPDLVAAPAADRVLHFAGR